MPPPAGIPYLGDIRIAALIKYLLLWIVHWAKNLPLLFHLMPMKLLRSKYNYLYFTYEKVQTF